MIRFDKLVALKFPEYSRSQIQKLILSGSVTVDGEVVLRSANMFSEDVVVKIDVDNVLSRKAEKVEYEDLGLKILYEDKDFICVDKPAGMVVYPVEGDLTLSGTLVNGIMKYLDKDLVESDPLRPGIVHRLDRGTSGVVLVARNLNALEFAKEQFAKRKVEKWYKALVVGKMEHPEGRVDSPIGRSISDRKKMSVHSERSGRSASTYYSVIEEFSSFSKPCSLLDVKIETGRTHQIRVHMSAIGHPIVGDSAYGVKSMNDYFKVNFEWNRQFLHAYRLSFLTMDKKRAEVVCPLPFEMMSMLEKL